MDLHKVYLVVFLLKVVLVVVLTVVRHNDEFWTKS